MRKIEFGSVLDVTHGIIVHGCNAQGVMGSGVAAAVKSKYPYAFEVYSQSPKTLGSVSFARISGDLIIANGITQEFYGKNADVRYVSYAAVKKVFVEVQRKALALMPVMGNLTVHYPMIGAGLGNGEWSIISEIIDNELSRCSHVLWIQD